MNDTPLSVHIATLVVLLLLSGFFSGSETSLMSVNRFRIRHQAKSGNLAAQRVERLLSHPDKLLTMILIGNNLVNIYASSIATIVSMRLFGSYAVAVSTFIMTLVVLIFGEITPKSISAAHAETVAKLVSLPIVWLMWLLKPAVIVMNSISHLIMFILRIDPQKTEEGWLGADELSYNLHILLRYELEKELFDGALSFRDLPEAWNERSASYLGVRPRSDGEGVLQDMHWFSGYIGYFQSYTLGNCYAAQFLEAMEKDLPDLFDRVRQGDFASVKAWNGAHIHRFGATRPTRAILRDATGEDLNAGRYVRYLAEKYARVYGL